MEESVETIGFGCRVSFHEIVYEFGAINRVGKDCRHAGPTMPVACTLISIFRLRNKISCFVFVIQLTFQLFSFALFTAPVNNLANFIG
jgi:hypothetical protein